MCHSGFEVHLYHILKERKYDYCKKQKDLYDNRIHLFPCYTCDMTNILPYQLISNKGTEHHKYLGLLTNLIKLPYKQFDV